jgi:hypothetical protein
MITVKLIELGSEVKEYALESGSDLNDLLEAAEKDFSDGTITRNSQVLDEDSELHNGDRIFIGKATKGNLDPFEVNFIRLGDTSVALAAEDGYTIKRTLEQLSETEKTKFFRADGSMAYEFRVGGGQPVDENHILQRPGSGAIRVICSQRVKGNK